VVTGWVYERALGALAGSDAELHHVIRAYDALRDVDIVHDHTILGPLYAQTISTPPVVTTNHAPFTAENHDIFSAISRSAVIIAISRRQRATATEIRIGRVIHHGVDVERIAVGDGRGGYVAFLGRMSPDKGPDRAIRAARRAGVPIVVAAKMREPAEHRYFEEKVAPLLGDDARFVGEVGGWAKFELLQNAIALVNPIRWVEPFGLVMIEALACGTPVIAFPHGAAPEIVQHGRNGFLCDGEAELADAIARIGDLDRRECRRCAELAFSSTRMVAEHERLYDEVLSGRMTAAPALVASGGDPGKP
jgi:glycosyltransferase involved in cell wall biosynthesis